MKKAILSLAVLLSLTAMATDYDQNKPFGFCTRSSRTDASKTYDLTGGGCYTYPVPESFTGSVIVLKSTGKDMKSTIENAIKQNKVIIFDGSDGDFIVSSNIGVTSSGKTLLGINNARLCTKWYVTDEIKAALNAAGVPNMSTSSGGGTLPNGQSVTEEAEYNTRRIIIQLTGDNNESYRNSGVLSLSGCSNIIIRNITFVGPGSVDVGGSDLISSTGGAKNIWVDHCAFSDGMDGNFDITQKSDFHTVSWCTFTYTARSYMHQNTNLIGSSDSETTGYLNTTFAYNWWGTGCKQRMPMARVGKIHMLNNYYTCSGSSNCINPRKNSEFLIEGNYIAKGVKNYYSQSSAKAVTWLSNNYIAESSSLPSSFGTAVTVPYTYTAAAASEVPAIVQGHAGATLTWNEGGSDTPTEGTTGSIIWAFTEGNSAKQATITSSMSPGIASTSVTLGNELKYDGTAVAGGYTMTKIQQTNVNAESATAANAITFSINLAGSYKLQPTSVSFTASRIGTDRGLIDANWIDGTNGTVSLLTGVTPDRQNNTPAYTTFEKTLSVNPASDVCQLVLNLYNLSFTNENGNNYKDYGFCDITINANLIDTTTGISTPVSLSPALTTEYYNASGQRVDAQTRGLVIIRQRMADGTILSKKVFR